MWSYQKNAYVNNDIIRHYDYSIDNNIEGWIEKIECRLCRNGGFIGGRCDCYYIHHIPDLNTIPTDIKEAKFISEFKEKVNRKKIAYKENKQNEIIIIKNKFYSNIKKILAMVYINARIERISKCKTVKELNTLGYSHQIRTRRYINDNQTWIIFIHKKSLSLKVILSGNPKKITGSVKIEKITSC